MFVPAYQYKVVEVVPGTQQALRVPDVLDQVTQIILLKRTTDVEKTFLKVVFRNVNDALTIHNTSTTPTVRVPA